MSAVIEPILQILLVENDEDDYFLTRALLGRIPGLKFELRWIPSFVAALEYLAKNQVDVCLIDFYLESRTGLELLQALRETPLPYAHPACIILTGGSDRDTDVAVMHAGADDYLVKSQIDAESLAHALRYAVARRSAAEEMRRSEERFRLAVRATGEAIWEWNVIEKSLWVSDEFAPIFGALDETRTSVQVLDARIHPQDRSSVVARLLAALQSDTQVWTSEFRFCRNDGTYAIVLARGCIVRDGKGAALRVVGTLSDISERKAWEEQLVHRAFHDPLTQLPNRALFMDRLERALARARRNPQCRFAVIFLDLDGFKAVNDSRGHLAGDGLLRDVAVRLQCAVRPGDTVARLGGDEFAALLDDIADENEAMQVASRIHEALFLPLQIVAPNEKTQEIRIGASIGITLGSSQYTRPEDILRDSDIAMYRAKAAMREDGAPHIVFHSEATNDT